MTDNSINQKWENYVNGTEQFATEDDIEIATEFQEMETNKLTAIGRLLDRIKTINGENCNTDQAAIILATMIVNAEMTEDDYLANLDEITDDEIRENSFIN